MISTNEDRVLSPADVMRKTSLSRTTLWRLSRRDGADFPRPIQLSPGRIGWRASEIEQFLSARQSPIAA